MTKCLDFKKKCYIKLAILINKINCIKRFYTTFVMLYMPYFERFSINSATKRPVFIAAFIEPFNK